MHSETFTMLSQSKCSFKWYIQKISKFSHDKFSCSYECLSVIVSLLYIFMFTLKVKIISWIFFFHINSKGSKATLSKESVFSSINFSLLELIKLQNWNSFHWKGLRSSGLLFHIKESIFKKLIWAHLNVEQLGFWCFVMG